MGVIETLAKIVLLAGSTVLLLYTIRHYLLSWRRLTLARPDDTMELVGYVMPKITVMVPMHNEERVAPDVLQALLDNDYDWSRLQIVAIDDRSTDGTAAIIDDFAARHPMIRAFHRTGGDGGKPAALREAGELATGEILLLFDADYIPGRSMLKMLVAPFADPEVGAVMGRVVPHNAGQSLLAGLLSMERAAGYQTGQQSRQNATGSAQFGGTVGGVRLSALRACGGWNPNSLTEDTDLTCALIIRGWKVAYVNRAECYEEVPQSWIVRRRQLMRWVMGHTACMHRYWRPVLKSPFLTRTQKIDTLFMLACYLTAPALVLSWLASIVLLVLRRDDLLITLPAALAFLGYQLFANQATFVELGVASLLDGARHRILLLPVHLLNFFASHIAICDALLRFYGSAIRGGGGRRWEKTRRFRQNRPADEPPPGIARRTSRGVYEC